MNSIERFRGMGMNRLGLTVLLASGFATAGSIADNQSALEQKVEELESRQGVDVGGSVRAVFVRSQFSSPQDVDGINQSPDREQNEFAQLDLELGFRPWAQTRVNALIRMEGGMQQYFAASSKSVTVPWMNIEGQLGGVFYWVVGDFRQQISPLTLFSPDLDLMYEPTVFARNRKMARDQALLEGNQRNLQGVNLQYRDSFGETVGEVRAEGIFSRLRRVEYLDASGAMGNILPNEEIAGASQAANMDKYLLSANTEIYPLSKGLMAGATYMMVWDDKKSFTRVQELIVDESGSPIYDENGNVSYASVPMNKVDTTAQNSTVLSIRLGADGSKFLSDPNLILEATAELAKSTDDLYDVIENEDESIPSTLSVRADDGSAMLAQLQAGYQVKDSWMSKVQVNYLNNDSSWFNGLAQSPSFFARRIMNSEKDANTVKFGVNSPLYSTFDAMYHFSPKFSPAASSLANDDNAMIGGQSESYNIAPYVKNSWTSATYTRQEIRLVNALSDPTVQMLLPSGLATANRTGFSANLVGGLGKDNVAEVQGLYASMKEVSSSVEGLGAAEFTEMGAGAKVDVFALLEIPLPLELSASYKSAKRTQGDAELKTNFINAGIYVRYMKRFGVTAGYQIANMEYSNFVEGNQKQWMAGLDYTLAKNAWLAINFGQISVENTYQFAAGLEDSDGDGVVEVEDFHLPDYVVANADVGSTKILHKFTQDLIDVSINVEF